MGLKQGIDKRDIEGSFQVPRRLHASALHYCWACHSAFAASILRCAIGFGFENLEASRWRGIPVSHNEYFILLDFAGSENPLVDQLESASDSSISAWAIYKVLLWFTDVSFAIEHPKERADGWTQRGFFGDVPRSTITVRLRIFKDGRGWSHRERYGRVAETNDLYPGGQ